MKIKIEIDDHIDPLILYGSNDSNLKEIEKVLHIELFQRGRELTLKGSERAVKDAALVVEKMQYLARKNKFINSEEVKFLIQKILQSNTMSNNMPSSIKISSANKYIKLKNITQQKYYDTILKNDITFGIGPAGTGKTYIAVAIALNYLMQEKIKKIILTRPVVEAGESLGFLPGNLEEKIDPYLTPLMDSIYDMLTISEINKYKERGQIEIAPLAYMRGRTLNNSFIILDEAQNTSITQMKMFLTRLGHNSKVIVTGDITQKDLPNSQKSGVELTMEILNGIEGLNFVFFDKRDVVRHPIVKKIIEAFEKHEETE